MYFRDNAKQEISDVVGLDASDAVLTSAKTGEGIPEILERIVRDIPAPSGNPDAPLQALIFDSVYDNYRGVICYIRVVNGSVKAGQNIMFMSNGITYPITEAGVFKPGFTPVNELKAGEVGYITASIKTLAEAQVGDTITDANNPASSPLPGYKKLKSVVFCGFYPVERDNYPQLRDALEKL